MRQIEDIAKNGWEAWVTRVRSWRSEEEVIAEAIARSNAEQQQREMPNYAQPTEEEMVEILRRLRERGEQMRQEFEQRQVAEAAARSM